MTVTETRRATHLRCSEGCGTVVAREYRGYACPTCGNLLEAVNDPGGGGPEDWKQTWRQRRSSNHSLDSSGVWRFREFLPA